MKISLGICNFLEGISSLSHSIFSTISLHWSLRKAFLSLLDSLWNSAFKWVYLYFSPWPFASLFTAICKASSDNHFAFLHFFSLGMVLIPASCTMDKNSYKKSFIDNNYGFFISDTQSNSAQRCSLTKWIKCTPYMYKHYFLSYILFKESGLCVLFQFLIQ